ncbi:hypothetical protein M231_03449 [Tremella mesenterica]|uniref:Zn(2)-C6 fungal-type domain-containing protein n=1 Tax=Tremella mesenterica TaxID=5217 RepID=A0A4Q1BN10_TREME|nr:hypothetical protein M231_03449 [Tremella mesenterica]
MCLAGFLYRKGKQARMKSKYPESSQYPQGVQGSRPDSNRQGGVNMDNGVIGDVGGGQSQNVACDACKLRRVKCDLLYLLTPPSVEDENLIPPLHELVRQNPDTCCTNCKNKGLRCTTNQILNPSRPNKSGRRIDEAREVFGGGTGSGMDTGMGDMKIMSDSVGEMDNSVRNVDGLINGMTDVGGMNEGMRDLGVVEPGVSDNDERDMRIGEMIDWSKGGDNGLPTIMLDNSYTFHPLSFDTSNSLQPQSLPGPSRQSWISQPLNDVYLDELEGLMMNITQPTSQSTSTSSESPPENVGQSYLDPNQLTSNHIQHVPNSFQSTTIPTQHVSSSTFDSWQDFLKSPNSPSNIPSSQLASHTSASSAIPLPPGLGRFSVQRDQFVKDGESSHVQIHQEPVRVMPVQGSWWRDVDRYTENTNTNQLVARKRGRWESETMDGEMIEDEWKLWAEDQKSLRWGRKENVQEALADRTLGLALSRHLVKVFFHSIHLSLPILSPESFYLQWEKAGQRSDNMSPAQEALCAVIEAWAARYSDSPVILGMDPKKAKDAPKVITSDGRFLPGTQARAHWGRARLGACNALASRARNLISSNGLLFTPSLTGVQAVTMFIQLMNLTDQKDRAEEQYMQNSVLQAAVVEQMRVLGLMRIFWSQVVADAYWAAGTGQSPKIGDEELSVAGQWLEAVQEDTLSPTFRMLVYYNCALIARKMASAITSRRKHKGAIDVVEFCQTVRNCWEQLQGVAKAVLESKELMDACDQRLLGFSPVNSLANIRLSVPLLMLVLHQQIREVAEFHAQLRNPFPVEEVGSASPENRNESYVMLKELETQSVDVLLHSCRAHVDMFQALLPTGIIQTASVMLRVLVATGQFLAEVPTNEQGYPSDTLGGCGWTWETKKKEVGCCVDALYQIGWAWSDIAEALDTILVSMERLQPSPSVLSSYHDNPPPPSVEMEKRRAVETIQSQGIIQSALRYWPPPSIPNLLEAALSQNSHIENPDNPDLFTSLKTHLSSTSNNNNNYLSSSSSSRLNLDIHMNPIPTNELNNPTGKLDMTEKVGTWVVSSGSSIFDNNALPPNYVPSKLRTDGKRGRAHGSDRSVSDWGRGLGPGVDSLKLGRYDLLPDRNNVTGGMGQEDVGAAGAFAFPMMDIGEVPDLNDLESLLRSLDQSM